MFSPTKSPDVAWLLVTEKGQCTVVTIFSCYISRYITYLQEKIFDANHAVGQAAKIPGNSGIDLS